MYKPKWIHFISILLIFLIVSCSSNRESSPTDTELSADPTWQFEQQVRATGKIILSNSLDLSFAITGNVVELLVAEGDTINQGDVIAHLDTRLLEQEIANAEADLEVAKANLARALVGPSQAEFIQAGNDLIAAQAIRPLSAAQATIQVVDIDSAQARLDHLDSLPLPEDVALAQADVDRAQTRVVSTQARLERSVLVAPINGTVLEVFIHAYEYAGIGQPVVRLSDINDLSLEVWMDELDVPGLSIGDEVTVTFEALPGVSAQAVITSFSPILDINDPRDFVVELKLLDVPDGLRWGMTAEVSFSQ
jgi:multidrug efflux pump subunit AcrA (membrane-fusion protein)